MPRSVPTVRLLQLGEELRRLRDARKLSADNVGAQLGWSASKVTRIETAFTRPSPTDVERMLEVYGVDSATRASLLDLAHKAQQRGWWVPYGDVFTTPLVAVEDVARRIRDFEPQVIPGLLQTEGYARAIFEASVPGDPVRVERAVRARMARKILLDRATPPDLTAIITEPVLRWPIGGPEVMRGQLQALLDASERPNVDVLVLPMSAGAHAGLGGPAVIFSFEPDDFPDVAYLAGQAGGNYVESNDQVNTVTMNWNLIADKALSAEESAQFIADLRRGVKPVS